MHLKPLLFFLLLFVGSFAVDNVYETEIEDKNVSVAKGEVIRGDYFALGDTVIKGTVEGSVYLFGAEINIQGDIHQDLIAVGGNILITGNIGGNVRLIAAQAFLEGTVGGNVALIGANIMLPSTGEIRGDLLTVAGNVGMGQTVDGSLTAVTACLTLGGTVKKNVRTFVDTFRITSTGHIAGKLTYRSRHPVIIDKGAVVEGKITYRGTLLKHIEGVGFFKGMTFGAGSFHLIVKFFYTFVIGVLLRAFFFKKLERTVAVLRTDPLRCFVFGLSVLVLLPVLTGMLLVTVVGAPFALTLLALNIISFYTVIAFPIFCLSNVVARKMGQPENTLIGFALGLIVYMGLSSIPVFGFFAACFGVIFGFGAGIAVRADKD